MTDRHAGYVVTLAHDLREDDAEATITALRMVRGVISVTPVEAGADLGIAEMRAKNDMRQRLLDLLDELR